MSHFELAVTGLGAALAALVYIARTVRQAARQLETWADLPKAHADLAEQTRANTEAIARLTVEVRRLALVESARGEGP